MIKSNFKNKKLVSALKSIFYPLVVTAAVLALWAIAAVVLDFELLLPTPKQAFEQFFVYLSEPSFWTALGLTFFRAIYAFAISFVIALALAVLSSVFTVAKRLITPLMAILRAVPTMAIILLLIIWLSPSVAPALVAIVVICPTLFSAYLASIEGVDPQLIEMSKVYGVKTKDMILKLYLPNMASSLFKNTAAGISLNIKLVIAAEALAQTSKSIGKMMQFAKITLEPTKLFALTIAAVLVSVAAEAVILFVGKRVVRWQK